MKPKSKDKNLCTFRVVETQESKMHVKSSIVRQPENILFPQNIMGVDDQDQSMNSIRSSLDLTSVTLI